MKRLLELLLFALTIYGLLMLCSCEKQEMIIEEEFVPTSFEEDPFYNVLNDDSTVEEYIDVFLKDAKRHGVDYTGLIQSMRIIREEAPIYTYYEGYSANGCDPFNNTIGILVDWWDKVNFDGTYKDGHYARKSAYNRYDEYSPYYKLKIIYHELGHEILGYGHTCEPGHIMTDNEPCGRLWGEVGDGDWNGGLFNMATLRYQHDNELRVWGRAVDDLFSKHQQVFLQCRNSFYN
jgi:hypothetical protein